MKRIVIWIVVFVFLGGISIFGYLLFINKSIIEKGALQITSNVKANVEIEGQKSGQTPLCKCNQDELLKSGSYEIKIIPEDTNLSPYTVRAKVEPNVLTAVDRTFLDGSLSSSYIISLERSKVDNNAELFIASIPDGALITIDSNPSGITPYLEDSISSSEHEIEIQKQGFAKKTLRVRAVVGYRLIVNVVLGTEASEIVEIPAAEDKNEEISQQESISILSTPTGFLRVRSGAGITFDEVGRVSPGESYKKLDENNGWYKIELSEEKNGWVSAEFAEIKNSQ